MIVLDANVVAKAYLSEAGSAEATELLTGPRKLLAPELIRLEVAGAITRRVRQGELKPEEARVRCSRWFAHLETDILALTPDRDLLPAAAELSIELRHALQDCMYLALAKRCGALLVTADDTFFKRAGAAHPKSLQLFNPKHN